MNLHQVPILQALFSRETPFGPAATDRDPEYTYLDIYHPTERFEKSLATRHNVVFGRRGAGKSSLIQRILRGTEYEIKITLDKDVIIESLKAKLGQIEPTTTYCESIARLWIHLFWLAVFKHIVATEEDVLSIRKITGATVSSYVLGASSGTLTGLGTISSNFNVNIHGQTASGGANGFTLDSLSVTASAIPEPSTYALIFGTLALAGVVIRRRRQNNAARQAGN